MANFTPDDAWLRENFQDLTEMTLLGHGGQKIVFSARHLIDGAVVLKVFNPSQGVNEVQREILAVTQVQSGHVPKILGQGVVETPLGACFWVREELVRGETLRERLKRGALPALDVLRLGKQILDPIVRAEGQQIVHRDVKPENIIIDAEGKFWLIDFGIARHLLLDSLTATLLPWGKMTPGYSPPEQVRNDKRNIDSRADLFALGVTLYESALGVQPFYVGAQDAREVLRQSEANPLPPLNLPIQQAGSFHDLVAAMTQKRRDHRPRNAAEAFAWITEICEANGL